MPVRVLCLLTICTHLSVSPRNHGEAEVVFERNMSKFSAQIRLHEFLNAPARQQKIFQKM